MRYLYTRQTPTIFAGSRWQHLEGKIPFGYQELVDAIGTAIDKSAANGAHVVDKLQREAVVERNFSDVMAEAKSAWTDFFSVEGEEAIEHRTIIMKEILRRVFGAENFKLSLATPGQKDLVELFIAEVRENM